MRKIVFLIATSLSLGLVDSAAAGGIRDRDASTQREMATGQRSAPAAEASKENADKASATYGLPGFVTPYGYPLPPYADGNNFATIHTGR